MSDSLTPAQQAEITALTAPGTPYWKPLHREHQATVQRVTALHGGAGPAQAPAPAEAEIKRLMAPDSPYNKPLHPDHQATVKRVTALFAQVAPAQDEVALPVQYSVSAADLGVDAPPDDHAAMAEGLQWAREHGLPDAAVLKGLADLTRLRNAEAAGEDPVRVGYAALHRDWGGGFTDNVNAVREYVARRPALADYLDRTGLGNSAAIAKALLPAAQREGRK